MVSTLSLQRAATDNRALQHYEEMLNIPSKQGSWERLLPWADQGSGLEHGPRPFITRFGLLWMRTGGRVWEVFGKPGPFTQLSLSSVHLPNPGIKKKHKPRVIMYERDHTVAS